MPKIQIRCTEEERRAWKAKAEAAGVPLSELLRQAVDHTRTWTAKDRRLEQERIRQFARIGNNLNQLARWANTYKEPVDAVEVIAALIAIERLLQKTMERSYAD